MDKYLSRLWQDLPRTARPWPDPHPEYAAVKWPGSHHHPPAHEMASLTLPVERPATSHHAPSERGGSPAFPPEPRGALRR